MKYIFTFSCFIIIFFECYQQKQSESCNFFY